MKRVSALCLFVCANLFVGACNLVDDDPAVDSLCGDGEVTGAEICDDGNTDSGDYCSANCLAVTGSCGDGDVQTGEVCDDGDTEDTGYCSADCQTVIGSCGDGMEQAGEACDDGNNEDGDYCSADCQTVTGRCGDGEEQAGEACDDGNNEDGDYCSFDCQTVDGFCGDALVQADEVCDDGNNDGGDYCAPDCSAFTGRCGDGEEQENEVCDDGNNDSGDYCSDDCQAVTGSCGDGVLQAGEECDDGNGVEGDLCDPGCRAVELLIEGEFSFGEETTLPPGARVRLAEGAKLIVREHTLSISEGVRFVMGRSSEIVVAAQTLRVDGSEAYPVSFVGEDATCGSWFGIRVTETEGLVALRHARILHVTRGLYADDVTVNLDDVEVSEVCASAPASIGGAEPFDVFGVDVRRSEVRMNGVLVSRLQGQNGSTFTLRDGGATGTRGGNAYGIYASESRLDAMNGLTVLDVVSGRGGDGQDSGRASFDGGDGGVGGEAVGIKIEGARNDIALRRVRVVRVTAEEGGDGGLGTEGIPGMKGSDGTAGGAGTDGGDGGQGGNASGLDVQVANAVVLENVLVDTIVGGMSGDGSDGGTGGAGGDATNVLGVAGNGGDGGDAGRMGQRGLGYGVFVDAPSATLLHMTVRGIVDGMYGALGAIGMGGRAGSGGVRRASNGANGRLLSSPAEIRGSCVLFDGRATVGRLVYSALVVSSPVIGVAAVGATVTSEYNLLNGFEVPPYEDVTPGVGNIGGDPLFVDAAAGDLRPQAASPLVNAAETSVTNLDLDSNSRDNLPDIGAYEYVP